MENKINRIAIILFTLKQKGKPGIASSIPLSIFSGN